MWRVVAAVARRRTGAQSALAAARVAATLPNPPSAHTTRRHKAWSVETETGHTYKDPATIIDDAAIWRAIENGKKAARDPAAVRAVLDAARERAFLTDATAEPGPSEFVRGLSLDEAGVLLGVDAYDADAMAPIYQTALDIKHRIYAKRIVLFAPLYIANYCVNVRGREGGEKKNTTDRKPHAHQPPSLSSFFPKPVLPLLRLPLRKQGHRAVRPHPRRDTGRSGGARARGAQAPPRPHRRTPAIHV